MLDGFGLLDLGDDRRVTREGAGLEHVGRAAHEGQRHVVDAEGAEREGEVYAVLLGERGRRELRTGHVDALAVREGTADFDDATHVSGGHVRARDTQAQSAVVEQDDIARDEVRGQRRVGLGDLLCIAGYVAQREGEGRALDQLDGALGESPDAHLRAGEVGEDRHGATGAGGGGADPGGERGVARVVPVGEVQARAVQPRGHELVEDRGRAARGAQGADDAGLTHVRARRRARRARASTDSPPARRWP